MTTQRLIIGVMTGTSLDAIDAALVNIEGHALDIRCRLLRETSTPLGDLAERGRAIAAGQPHTARQIAAFSLELSAAIADAVRPLSHDPPPHLVVVHGQTLCHSPPVSWQAVNAAVIARRLRTTLLTDLRAADLAAGGQGAPITPIADAILFSSPSEPRAVVNLGGFVNITNLPAGRPTDDNYLHRIAAADLCPCNHLLDAAARLGLGTPFDHNGDAAANADPNPLATRELQRFTAEQAANAEHASLGDTQAPSRLVASLLDAGVPPAALARAAAEAIAHTVARAVPEGHAVLLAGGGTKHRVLRQTIADALHKRGDRVALTDEHSIPTHAREAAAMAVLGALCEDNLPITLPNVTRCQSPPPTAGAWTRPPVQ